MDFVLKKVIKRAQVVESPKGNLVEIEDGHAAVSGDETCQSHCPEVVEGWEGARRPWEEPGSGICKETRDLRRMIRKSEDPPECASRLVFDGRL